MEIADLLTIITGLLSVQTVLMCWYMSKLYTLEKRISTMEGKCSERMYLIQDIVKKVG